MHDFVPPSPLPLLDANTPFLLRPLLLLAAWVFLRRPLPPPTSALITGAAHGIGRAIALRLAGRGTRLVLLDRNAVGLRAVASECAALGAAVLPLTVDVCDSGAVAAACDTALRWNGGVVHTVVSCAGGLCGRDVETLSAQEVDRTLALNVGAAFSLLRGLLPAHRSAAAGVGAGGAPPPHTVGAWVFISSMMGRLGGAQLADYSASKWALHGLAASLRVELGRDGLTGVLPVHLVCPWVVSTGLFEGAFGDARATNPLRAVLYPPLTADTVAEGVEHALRSRYSSVVTLPWLGGVAVGVATSVLPTPVLDWVCGWAGGWWGMAAWVGRH